MKLMQIAFIVVLGATCWATYATSQTLHMSYVAPQQDAPAERRAI